MKLPAVLFSALAGSSVAFHVALPQRTRRFSRNPLFESTAKEAAAPYDIDDSAVDLKQDLLYVAQSLKDEYGPLIIDSKAQKKLERSVEALENNSDPPISTSGMIGEWTLLCSTASAEKVQGIDTSKLPFFNADPVKEIRNTLNKSLMVQQLIKSEKSGGIDRVDHVIQYMPPSELSEFVSNLPDFLQTFNINPLEVTNEKVVLVHKAEVESTIPFIKTKLSLESVVGKCRFLFSFLSTEYDDSSCCLTISFSVNVAGKSRNLDPAGADILGINVPFGEFLNSGTFDTTYMDDELRISRSKVGVVDQLRVFVRSAPRVEEPVVEEEAPVEDEEEISSPSDVEEEASVEDEKEIDSPSDVEEAEIVNEAPAELSVDEGDENIEAPSDVETED
jgi:hypothetical protein